MRRTRSDFLCSYCWCRFATWTTLKSRQLQRCALAVVTYYSVRGREDAIRQNMFRSCQSLLCGQVNKHLGKMEVERLGHRELQAPAQHRTLTCAHYSMFFLFPFGVLRHPAQRAALAKGTFSQNPKESLVAEEALVGHAEATKIAEADFVVTHPKHAYQQSSSNSTR